jgi:hypothetical protein
MQPRHHILGLSTNEEPCPVCNVKPQIFRDTMTDNVVECGRCGLPSEVDQSAPAGQRIPRPAANPAWVGIFKRYWQETGAKITAPELVGPDVELAGRHRELQAWLVKNNDVVEAATLAIAAPYASITAICVEIESADGGEMRRAWSLILPQENVGRSLSLPVSPGLFEPGTILTIQTPNSPPQRGPGH